MPRAARIVFAIERGLRICAALCLLALTLLVLAQVALRYGGGSVPPFIEELARYAMVWMALMVAAVAARERSHIGIDTFLLLLGSASLRLRRGAEALLDVLSLGIFLMLAWYGIGMVSFAAMQKSDGMRIPLSYPYAIVPVAFGFAALFALARLTLADARK